MTGSSATLEGDTERRRDGAGAWKESPPVLRTETVLLRELEADDAPSLFTYISNPTILRYISPPPTSVGGFKQFIEWACARRGEGRHLCFGILPQGQLRPVGLIQIWPIESDFSIAEWGFVVGEPWWGTGLAPSSSRLLLDFAFENLGVRRLETRAVEANPRVTGLLRKLGAVREGTLRDGFRHGDTVMDSAIWSILASEWRARREVGR